MSASLLRYSALAALVSAVVGSSRNYGAMPSQTAGQGLPIQEAMPTEAPSLELVKRQLEKKQNLVNVCSEWTILGGNGQPQCSNSQTCLFSSVGGVFYEGCGQENIRYDWITECSPYPNSGTAGPSSIYCNSAFPSCGTFKFVFEAGTTFSNFGCSNRAYSYVATLLQTSRTIGLPAGSSSTLDFDSTEVVTVTSTSTTDGGGRPTSSSPGSLTKQRKSKKSTPIGAIVGGVIGGIAVIALLGFIAWYCLKKRKQDKTEAAAIQAQQSEAATAQAYHNTNRIPEVDGTNIAKPGVGAFAPVNHNYVPPSEKPIAGVAANEYRPQPQTQYSSGYGSEVDPRSGTASPPPMYAQPPHQNTPPQNLSSPSSQYTELDPSSAALNTNRNTMPPVSPAGTNTGTFVTSNVSELGGGENRMSYQAYHPPGSPPAHEMAAGAQGAGNASSGGINRRPVGQQQHPSVDMSGNPMTENFRPHELP